MEWNSGQIQREPDIMSGLGPLWSMGPYQKDNWPPPFWSSASVRFNCSHRKSHWILSHISWQTLTLQMPSSSQRRLASQAIPRQRDCRNQGSPNKTCICDPATPLEGTPKGNLKSAHHRDTSTHAFTAMPFTTDGYRTSLGPVNS